jgi:uncharacterized membrane protein YhaH (DUF805 family)
MFGLTETAWTVFMIIIATLVYVFLIFTRNMREAAGVGIWALVAITVKQGNFNESIVMSSIAASSVLFILIAFQAYRNRRTLPHKKLARGEI